MMGERREPVSGKTAMPKQGNQAEYNRLLDSVGGHAKSYQECVDHLVGLGYSETQAKNAAHVYRKGGATLASFRLSRDNRDRLLDRFGARRKTPKECVSYLMKQGCTYRHATSAVYQFRKEKGLIP